MWNWKWNFSSSGDFFRHLLTRKAWNWATIVNSMKKRVIGGKGRKGGSEELSEEFGGGASQAFTPFKFFILFHTKLTFDPNLVTSALHLFLRERRQEQEPKLDLIWDQTDAACILWYIFPAAQQLRLFTLTFKRCSKFIKSLKAHFQERNQSQNMHYCPKIHTKLIDRFRPQRLKKNMPNIRLKYGMNPNPSLDLPTAIPHTFRILCIS